MAQCTVGQCEICERASGIHFCINCTQKFCEDCKNQHKRIKATKFHRFQGSSEVIPKANWKCDEHEDEFRFVCRSCDILVCSVCVTEKHNGHKLSGIKELVQQNEKVLKEKLSLLGNNSEELQAGITLFESKVESVIDAIRQQGVKMKTVVDQYIDKLIDQLQKEAEREKKKLEEPQKEAENFERKGKQIERLMEGLAQAQHDKTVIEKLKSFEKELDRFTVAPLPKFPTVTYDAPSLTEDFAFRNIGRYSLTECVITEQNPNRNPSKGVSRKIVYRCKKCSKDKTFGEGVPIPATVLCHHCNRGAMFFFTTE